MIIIIIMKKKGDVWFPSIECYFFNTKMLYEAVVALLSSSLTDLRSNPAPPVHANPGLSLHTGGDLEAN